MGSKPSQPYSTGCTGNLAKGVGVFLFGVSLLVLTVRFLNPPQPGYRYEPGNFPIVLAAVIGYLLMVPIAKKLTGWDSKCPSCGKESAMKWIHVSGDYNESIDGFDYVSTETGYFQCEYCKYKSATKTNTETGRTFEGKSKDMAADARADARAEARERERERQERLKEYEK